MATRLCARCQTLDLAGIRDGDGDMQDLVHQPTLLALERAATAGDGCVLCALFLDGLLAEIYEDVDGHSPVAPIPDAEKASREHPVVVRGRAHLDEDYVPQGTHALAVRWDNRSRPGIFYCTVYADDADPAGSLVDSRLVATRAVARTAEESVAGSLKGWMAKCDAEHEACRPHAPDTTPLPTRVLDLGVTGAPCYPPSASSTEDIRLFVSNGHVAPYATLSHCWGPNPETVIRTTAATLDAHLAGIPLSRLSKTFRDAVAVCRAVGLRYLWIDSLCIVQDDAADWERESAVMGDIYRLSRLTVAASGSPGSSGGCFLPRSRDAHAPVRYTVTGDEFADTAGNDFFFGNNDDNDDDDNDGGGDGGGDGNEAPASGIGQVWIRPHIRGFRELPRSVLHSRAWVLQERLLSPRTVHFDTDQTLWECRAARWTEDRVDPEPASDGRHTANLWDGRVPLSEADAGARPAADFVADWYQVVENFTGRAITQGGDRLPALSGLAKTLEPLARDRYVAGLWESHLALGLLWRRARPCWLVPPAAGAYRAPSWSWASLDGQVIMHNDGAGISVKATSLRATVRPSTIDPRGRLASGSLTITGAVKLADRRVPGDYTFGPLDRVIGPDNDTQGAPSQWLRDAGVQIGKAFYDQHRTRSQDRVHCLLIAVHRFYIQKWYGLLLEPTGNPGEFRRLGKFEGNLDIPNSVNAQKSWFDDAQEMTITIV